MVNRVEILAPTLLEYGAVRCTFPKARTQWAGVRLARLKEVFDGASVVVCGLAGALMPGLRPGTVLIPECVGLPNGTNVQCDASLAQALCTAARALGLEPDTRPLLTTPALLVGKARHDWARRGFVAADMETGLLAGRGLRLAAVRVVLDGPDHEISAEWIHPSTALLRARAWRELIWLGRVAPQYALRAARILKVGLETLPRNMRM
jgi:hypothetical protein